MPIKSNLNIYPYYDDYDPTKDFYKVLFKPSVSVQMRELNQLQTILQTQIERFGDNVFIHGTIVSGCNFQFYKPYPYIKIPDNQTDGTPTIPSNYLGRFVYDDVSGLRAYIVNYQDGYELSDPDLKTLYVNYINSGNDGNTSAFIAGNNVTIYDGSYPINAISVINGGTGFSNADQVVVLPAMLVNVSLGTFNEADSIVNPITGANAEITAVDTTTVSGKVLLKVKPRDEDLTNSSVNSTAWSFELYDAITNPAGSAAGIIEQVYGGDVQARVVTNSVGTVQEIDITSGGKAYTQEPTASVKTSNAAVTIANLILSPENFVAKIKISSGAAAIGNGYAFGVTEGIIYQQGYFQRVTPQTVIISKYDPNPNNVSVGFSTVEDIIDSNEDESLLENALGVPNEKGPGADRLRLTPTLTLLTKEQAAANNEFFTLVEWNDGHPYKQNRVTQYSRLGDQMGSLIYDSSGNFVLDAFQVTTEAVANQSMESNYYTAVIDPGQAYINGRKVQTTSNYKIDMVKGIDTATQNNIISINYGNFVRVTELVGNFDFSAGGNVDLYDKVGGYVSNTTTVGTGTITPKGTKIGTARIRSLEPESGYPGTSSAVYRLYVFDVNMLSGQNFKNTKSIYYNGVTYKGLADVIPTFDATTSANIAQVLDTRLNSLLFYSGVESLKNSNNSTYTYRTSETVNVGISTATLVVTLNDVNEFFPYDGDLATSQMQEIVVVPLEAHLPCTNAVGTVAGNTSSNLVTGSGTTFPLDYAVGDYIMITDYGANEAIRRVVGVANGTQIQIDKPLLVTTSGLYHKRIFPKNVPIPFGERLGLYANVDVTEKILTMEFRHSNSGIMTLVYGQAQLDAYVAYNVERRGVTAATKTAVRNRYVKIRMSDNPGGIAGPWCLGIPDVFRLRAVYKGTSNSVAITDTEVTTNYYIDNNQNANFMGLGYLYKNPRSSMTLTKNDYLLVCCDYFTRDNDGYFDAVSYRGSANSADIATTDSLPFNELSDISTASSWEVPEVYTYDNRYYDLLNTFDFRPTAANTVDPTTAAAAAPLNPSATVTLAPYTKFPKPNAVIKTHIEQYLGRIDDIYIAGDTGNIYILKGIPDVNPRNRYQSNHPKDTLRLQTLNIPPYPNLCKTFKGALREILATRVSNEKNLNLRLKTHTIEPYTSTNNLQTSQPMVYTMEDIAILERRIRDLEYYVSLSLLETNVTNKIIPSSIDPSLQRFKFGFFADDFSTDIYCDLNNPQYHASIEVEGDFDFGTDKNPLTGGTTGSSQSNPIGTDISGPSKLILKATNRLVPPKRVWSLKHFTENSFYVDEEVLTQKNATDKPQPCVVNLGTQVVGNAYYSALNRNMSTIYFENLSGFVTIYFDLLPGRYGNGSKLTVYNGNNVVIASTDVAKNSTKQLTATDITFLSTSALARDFYNGLIVSNFNNRFARNSSALFDFGRGSGKIQVPASGGGKIIVKAASPDESSPNAKFLVEFPSMYSADRAIVNTPSCDPNPPVFKSGLESGALTITEWACSNIFRTAAAGYKGFVVLANGLKPNTLHKFYLDTVQWIWTIKLMTKGQAGFDNDHLFNLKSVTGDVGFAAGTILSMGSFVEDGWPPPEKTTRDDLVTDASGKIAFLVFFPIEVAGWFAQDFNVTGLYWHSNDAEIVSTSRLISDAQKAPTYGSSGYTTLLLKDASGTSAGARVFANRTPNKTIPDDFRATI